MTVSSIWENNQKAPIFGRGASLPPSLKKDEPVLPTDGFAEQPRGPEPPNFDSLRLICRQDLEEARDAHSRNVVTNTSLARELKQTARRYDRQGLHFGHEDRQRFSQAFHKRHEDVRDAEGHAYGMLSRDLQRLLGTLEKEGGAQLTRWERQQTAGVLFEGYQRLCKDPAHARESLAFVSKVAANESSPLFKIFDEAGLVDKVQSEIMEPALPAAWSQIQKSRPENPEQLREELLKELCGDDPSRRSKLAAQIEKELPAALERAKEIDKLQRQELVHGVLKEACGLLTGVPGAIFGIGAIISLTHAATMLRTKENRKEAWASLFDGFTQVSMTAASICRRARFAQLLGKIGGICGGVAAAVTLKQHFEEARQDFTVGTAMDYVGDVAGVVSAGMFLVPGAGMAALGLGLASAGMAVGAAILKAHDQKVKERLESDAILREAVPSFREVAARELR